MYQYSLFRKTDIIVSTITHRVEGVEVHVLSVGFYTTDYRPFYIIIMVIVSIIIFTLALYLIRRNRNEKLTLTNFLTIVITIALIAAFTWLTIIIATILS
jgi:hypothetical protein